MNMFLPSLPPMAEHFGVAYSMIQLSVPLYLMCSAFVQLFAGPISDNLGRRTVILWGLALFVLCSIGCLIAPNIWVFLFFRALQSTVAVAMVLSRAVLRDLHDTDSAASMIGYVTMGMAVAPMLSPALGGALQQFFGWEANFIAFTLIGLAMFALTWFDQGETAQSSGKTLWAQFREYPQLFKSPRFWGYSLTAAFSSGAFFAYLGGAPFLGSDIFGLSPVWLGVSFGSPAIGYALGNFLTGRYARVYGIDAMTLAGSILTTLGCLLSLILFMAGFGSPLSFFGLMTLVGIGNGLCIPNATAGLLSVRPHLAGTASGLGASIMIGGGAALSVLAGAVLSKETGATPLLWIMFLSSAAGIGTMLLVRWRTRQLGG